MRKRLGLFFLFGALTCLLVLGDFFPSRSVSRTFENGPLVFREALEDFGRRVENARVAFDGAVKVAKEGVRWSEKVELRVSTFLDGERVEECSTPSGDEERGKSEDVAEGGRIDQYT